MPSMDGRRALRETAAPEEGKKSHIGSEGVPFGIDWQKNEMHVARFIGALKILYDLLLYKKFVSIPQVEERL